MRTSMSIWVVEDHINATEHYHMGEPEPYETYFTDRSHAYRELLREHGRCIGKMYVNGRDEPVGWVFVKRDKYEDTGGPFLHETWVALVTGPDTVTRVRNYA